MGPCVRRDDEGNMSCRPCERRDPYAAAFQLERCCTTAFQQQTSVVMGPCVRRDDEVNVSRRPCESRDPRVSAIALIAPPPPAEGALWQLPLPTTNIGGYGSLRSQGRREPTSHPPSSPAAPGRLRAAARRRGLPRCRLRPRPCRFRPGR